MRSTAIDQVACALYEKWRAATVPRPKETWADLIDNPGGRDGDNDRAVAVWRDWARAAITAYEETKT